MRLNDLRLVPAGEERDKYLPLLHLADDSFEQVSRYYQTGDLYAMDSVDGDLVAIVLAILQPDESVELKAVAVEATLHGNGIGKLMLAAVLASLRAATIRRVVVGTGNSGIGQLAFYQKAGFRLWKIERDFFTAARGYADGLEENGIPLRDMVWMDQEL